MEPGRSRQTQILNRTVVLWSSVQFSRSIVSESLRPHDCSTPGLPFHHQLPEFTQTHVHQSVMPSNHLILCHPLFLLPPNRPSIRVFSNESALRMRWPKYWSFSISISPSKKHPGLISFRVDWLDDQLKLLLQVILPHNVA